jgi:uncharacterized membrane protein
MNKIFISTILIIVVILIYPITYYSQWNVHQATVTGKERITKLAKDHDASYYLVYTDKGTFKVDDELILFRFNSSDVYGSIHTDSTYTFRTVGFRSGFFSEYPNIVTNK